MAIETLRAGWIKRIADLEQQRDSLESGRLGTRTGTASTTLESLARVRRDIAGLEKMLLENPAST